MKQPKIRPGAGTPKRNEDENNIGFLNSFQSLPQTHCNSNEREKQAEFRISSILMRGEENAISTAKLMEFTGLSRRQLQEQIQFERSPDNMILSRSNRGGGYFLPDADPDKGRNEIVRFMSTVSSRGANTMKLVTLCNKALASIPGQQEVEGFAEEENEEA